MQPIPEPLEPHTILHQLKTGINPSVCFPTPVKVVNIRNTLPKGPSSNCRQRVKLAVIRLQLLSFQMIYKSVHSSLKCAFSLKPMWVISSVLPTGLE